MNEILIQILNAMTPVLVAGLTAFLAWLGTKIRFYFEEKTKNDTVRDIVKHTVAYVEQVFVTLKGEEKLDKAKQIALTWLKDKNIKITSIELEILIESFVNGLNTETKVVKK